MDLQDWAASYRSEDHFIGWTLRRHTRLDVPEETSSQEWCFRSERTRPTCLEQRTEAHASVTYDMSPSLTILNCHCGAKAPGEEPLQLRVAA